MRHRLLILSFGLIILLNGVSADTAKSSDDDQTIRVKVDMVSLPVVVTTRDGRRVIDLSKEDFQVFENGVEQVIAGFSGTDEPLAVALMLDTSGSTEKELARIQNAAIDFTRELHPDDEVAVLSFSNEVVLQQDFSIDRRRNEYGIKKTRPGGSTVLYEAVWLALEEVLEPKTERKALVIFSDGVDTDSSRANRQETVDLAKETRATIYSVFYDTSLTRYRTGGVTPGGLPGQTFPPIISFPPYPGPGSRPRTTPADAERGRRYLQELAEYSGGLVFDGKDDLRYAFEQVAKELASQYSIGYYPGNLKGDGKFRKIEVKVRRPDLVARTKAGYYDKKVKNR